MVKEMENTNFNDDLYNGGVLKRNQGRYEKYVKRFLDIICALITMIVFCPLYFCIALLVKIKLGSPVLFVQKRPGMVDKNGIETIFDMYKFRTMTDERDEKGNLLPDELRLTKFGKWLRSTSLDELPEVFNILNGTMSVVGPRPQLVRDMVFMSKEQRVRHTAKPGLSGLAQVNGRNTITWEEKMDWDIKYIQDINLINDIKIIMLTVKKAIIKKEDIFQENMATAEDYGDYLLRTGKISKMQYDSGNIIARKLLNEKIENEKVNLDNHTPFSVAMSVYKNDNPVFFDRAMSSITDNQTVIPDEIVLVVDGPINENLNNVIKKYQSKYSFFNVIYLEKNEGLGNALRVAVNNAKYNLIARMDSDDVAVFNRFEQQLSFFMNNPEIDIVGGDITEFIDDESNIVATRIVPQKNEDIRKYMKTRCAMNHVTVMYKKESIQKVGGYQDWFWNEDYYLWIRMWLNNSIFANTGTVLVNVRVGKEMYRRRGGKKYFESEKNLQKYMFNHNMIGLTTYIINVVKRWIVQILIPEKLRGWIFRTFARS